MCAANSTGAAQVATYNGLSANASTTTNGAYQLGQQVARQCIIDFASTALITSTGWAFHNTSGVYTRGAYTDYLTRAREPSGSMSRSCADKQTLS